MGRAFAFHAATWGQPRVVSVVTATRSDRSRETLVFIRRCHQSSARDGRMGIDNESDQAL